VTSPWRIIFFGTPDFAVPTLDILLRGPDPVIAVVTQPDRRGGRGQRILRSPVKEVALERKIELLQPEDAKEDSFQERLCELEPDLFVVVAYGQILSQGILDIPRKGSVNVHASLLPRYRGAAPIPWVILRGEEVTGVTTMMMDRGMDTGDILLQVEAPIGEKETFETLHHRLALLGARLMSETLQGLKTGCVSPKPQDPSRASYAPMIKKEDGHIDWSRGAPEIDRLIRAFNPWPGAFSLWEGRLLRIYGGETRKGSSEGKPGTVIWVGSDFIEVKTGKDSFRIREVQLEGGKRMSTKDFLLGHPVSVGTFLQ
jgi:methionyl-tRNA formyltransferase